MIRFMRSLKIVKVTYGLEQAMGSVSMIPKQVNGILS